MYNVKNKKCLNRLLSYDLKEDVFIHHIHSWIKQIKQHKKHYAYKMFYNLFLVYNFNDITMSDEDFRTTSMFPLI